MHPGATVRRLALASTLLVAAGPAFAGDDPATWSVTWENDTWGGTDRNYTNGNRLSYISPPDPPGTGTHGEIGRALLGAGPGDSVRFGLALGHSIFTPENIGDRDPPSDQHPYAGWLYGEYSVMVHDRDRLNVGTLQLGIVGPAAQGEAVQNSVHDWVNAATARGWDRQLANEPAFTAGFTRFERLFHAPAPFGLEVDGIPHGGASVGTVRTQAKLGGTLRLGRELRRDFGPPRVRPALGGTGFFEPASGWAWYIFAGTEARAVARNIFLDGNTFRDSASVDKHPIVADTQAGLIVTHDNVRLSYTMVARSPEYAGQEGFQIFGSLGLSVQF